MYGVIKKFTVTEELFRDLLFQNLDVVDEISDIVPLEITPQEGDTLDDVKRKIYCGIKLSVDAHIEFLK